MKYYDAIRQHENVHVFLRATFRLRKRKGGLPLLVNVFVLENRIPENEGELMKQTATLFKSSIILWMKVRPQLPIMTTTTEKPSAEAEETQNK